MYDLIVKTVFRSLLPRGRKNCDNNELPALLHFALCTRLPFMHVYETNTLHRDCGACNGQNFVRGKSRQVSLLNLAKGYEQFRRVCFIWRQEIRTLFLSLTRKAARIGQVWNERVTRAGHARTMGSS